VNKCCPPGIVELSQSLGRNGGGLSGFDFDPSGANCWGVGLIAVTNHPSDDWDHVPLC